MKLIATCNNCPRGWKLEYDAEDDHELENMGVEIGEHLAKPSHRGCGFVIDVREKEEE